MGVAYSWTLFRRFDINVFDYAETNDFLLAAFKDLTVFVMTMITTIGNIAITGTLLLWIRRELKSPPFVVLYRTRRMDGGGHRSCQ